MKILGIETSCDDTGIGIVEVNKKNEVKILANVIIGQDHRRTGGVVPEIAARRHATAILPAVLKALRETQLTIKDIGCLAVTIGPGLQPCLLVGVEAVKTISYASKIPVIGVNHLEAHLASVLQFNQKIEFPAVALIASGGNTMLVNIKKFGKYHIIGKTRDDAVGEAFDKVAKMLSLAYPGGPQIAKLALKGDPNAFVFPAPMINSADFDFSFAGIKTAVLYTLRKITKKQVKINQKIKADIAASFQEKVIQVLVTKTALAASLHQAKTVLLVGGVSANYELRARLKNALFKALPKAQFFTPASTRLDRPLRRAQSEASQSEAGPADNLFTDNGVMVALAAVPSALNKKFNNWHQLIPNPNLKL